MSYVYFIACKETWRWKVGFTKSDPQKRLKALQTGCPSELALMAYIEAGIDKELLIHNLFESERIRGEWFEGSDHFIAFVGLISWEVASKAIKEVGEAPEWTLAAIDAIEQSLDIDLSEYWQLSPVNVSVQ